MTRNFAKGAPTATALRSRAPSVSVSVSVGSRLRCPQPIEIVVVVVSIRRRRCRRRLVCGVLLARRHPLPTFRKTLRLRRRRISRRPRRVRRRCLFSLLLHVLVLVVPSVRLIGATEIPIPSAGKTLFLRRRSASRRPRPSFVFLIFFFSLDGIPFVIGATPRQKSSKGGIMKIRRVIIFVVVVTRRAIPPVVVARRNQKSDPADGIARHHRHETRSFQIPHEGRKRSRIGRISSALVVVAVGIRAEDRGGAFDGHSTRLEEGGGRMGRGMGGGGEKETGGTHVPNAGGAAEGFGAGGGVAVGVHGGQFLVAVLVLVVLGGVGRLEEGLAQVFYGGDGVVGGGGGGVAIVVIAIVIIVCYEVGQPRWVQEVVFGGGGVFGVVAVAAHHELYYLLYGDCHDVNAAISAVVAVAVAVIPVGECHQYIYTLQIIISIYSSWSGR
mmetsp:Transcript_30745/g.60010  ORF Transcript_30745/g.60010 Transcript_30745/m.60010 type:complete len:441 (-) Transcript_30745:38-1360(-)